MRALSIAAFLLFATGASAQEPSVSLPLAAGAQPAAGPENPPPSRRDTYWLHNELLGDALGRWLGVRNGRWDMFARTLAATNEGGPTIAGTIRKNAAEIQLRWRPDE
jgi:hypothetical protein